MGISIKKTAERSGNAPSQLYESNKQKIYFLCQSLLQNNIDAIHDAKQTITVSLAAVSKGEVQTEDVFSV